MLLLGVLVVIAAEVAAFVAVASQIGLVLTIVLLVVVSALGPVVVRRVGVSVLAQTRQRLLLGEVPTRELLDGLVVLVGGVLICVPGFVGDLLGLLLMLGPVRHLVIRTSGHSLARRVRALRRVGWTVTDVPGRPSPTAAPLPPGAPTVHRHDVPGHDSRDEHR